MARKKVIAVSDEAQGSTGQEDEMQTEDTSEDQEVQDETIQNLTPANITLNYGGKSVTIPAATLKGNGHVDEPGSAVLPASLLEGLERTVYFEALLNGNFLKRG